MENLNPLRQSNFSTACIKPRFPSWTRSSRGNSAAWYFLAIETTSRRFAFTKVSAASSPSLMALRSSRLRGTVSCLLAPISARAARPASMAWANLASSSFVSSECLPMSFRYRRTKSSSG